ncbi:MAG TPA: TolC family protein [Steroidobacteraceae bacterium]|nr:TolC family protein [Steroidobacteraceae bacterium]
MARGTVRAAARSGVRNLKTVRFRDLRVSRLCRGTMIVLLALAGACTHYQPAPLQPRSSAAEFAARRLTEPRLRDRVGVWLPAAAAEWPPQQWDRAQLLAVALVQNTQLAVARAQVQESLAQELTAREIPNPDLTLQSEYARHDSYAWLYGVSLSWLLRSPGRRHLEIEIARLDTGNTRLQLMDDTWAVRRELAAALSSWEEARRSLALLEQLAQLQQRLVEIEKQRVAAGEDAPSELLVHERAVIEIEQQQAQARTSAASAQAAVARAIGLPPEALDDIRFSWPDWGAPPPLEESQWPQTREQALLSRADLAICIQQYALAEARFHLAVARQYPQLELSPGYYYDHGIAKFPFDVGFTLPVNGNRGEIASARAAREVAGQRMLDVQAGIYGEIATAERTETLARGGAEAAARQLAAAHRQEQQAQLSQRLGESLLQEHIAARIIALRAELEVVQMKAQLQSARNALEDVVRAPLSGPELGLAKPLAAVAAGSGS